LFGEGVALAGDIFNLNELVQLMSKQKDAQAILSQINQIEDRLTALIKKRLGSLLNFFGGSFLALFNQDSELKQNIAYALKTALDIIVEGQAFLKGEGAVSLKFCLGIDWGDIFLAQEEGNFLKVIGNPITMAYLLQSLARDNEIIITNLVEQEDREFVRNIVAPFSFKMLTQKVSLRDKRGKIIRIMEQDKEVPQDFPHFLQNFFKFSDDQGLIYPLSIAWH
jgi:class 3 adenylate cyclase